jgi:tetratricopeptide (TPR) repeat protein
MLNVELYGRACGRAIIVSAYNVLFYIMHSNLFIHTIILCALGISLSAASPLFLERETGFALTARDEYYSKNGLTELLSFRRGEEISAQSLIAKIRAVEPDTTIPWYDFSLGIALLKDNPDSVSVYFNRAIDAAGIDIGTMFALSLEFGRFSQAQWEMKSIDRFKKMFLASGAQSSTLVSRTMLYKAISAEQNGDRLVAPSYYKWALAFDRSTLWPQARKILREFPLRPASAYEECAGMVALVLKSWPVQLAMVLHLFLWLRNAGVFLVLGAYIVLLLTYAPSALHWISDRFPTSVPQGPRTYFSCLLVLSFVSFGILPFLWVISCLLWRSCEKKNKILLAVCLAGLILYPLTVKIEDTLRSCLSPESSLTLFSKSIEEGYDADIDAAVRKNAQLHESDYLAHTAAALYAVKKNDMAFALASVQRARELRSEDPAVLLTEGNVYFLSGAFEKAKAAYETCMKLYPTYNPAIFNCGQYYLGTIETIKGMECIDRATKLDPAPTNSFIKTNDECFSKKWPRLRQLMAPEYQPLYFWTNVFPLYFGGLSSANTLWGASFLGLPIAPYFLISGLVAVFLLLAHFFAWSGDKPKQSFLCKLCKAAMCRQCKRGLVCAECYESLQPIRNENIRQRIIDKIMQKSGRIRRYVSYWADALFPGCGMVYRANGTAVLGAAFMTMTACVYATLPLFSCLTDTFPLWLPPGLKTIFYAAAPVYGAIFFIRAIVGTAREITLKEERHGP